jgi:hypothetical protein
MKIVAESLLHTGARDKVIRADEAVRLIRDGDSVVEGFGPRRLTLVSMVAPCDKQGRGVDRRNHEGPISRASGGHWGTAPNCRDMAADNARASETHQSKAGAALRPDLTWSRSATTSRLP